MFSIQNGAVSIIIHIVSLYKFVGACIARPRTPDGRPYRKCIFIRSMLLLRQPLFSSISLLKYIAFIMKKVYN